MAFSIVADIEEKTMEKQILKLSGKYFPDAPYNNEDIIQRKTSVPAAEPFDITLNKRNHQANCIIGGLAPSLYEEHERLTAVLLCNILGGPANNSILNAVLREKNGWVYGVECSYTQYTDTGIVTISLGCDKSNLDRCINAINKELTRLQEEFRLQKEMLSIKNHFSS